MCMVGEPVSAGVVLFGGGALLGLSFDSLVPSWQTGGRVG